MLHAYLVLPILFLVTFLAVGGVFTRSRMRRLKWKTKTILKIKKAHKGLAYSMIGLATLGILSGIYQYQTEIIEENSDAFGLIGAHFVYFTIVTLSLELYHKS